MNWLALALLALAAWLPSAASAQATLNKCIDAQGQVTYSNLPCRGARDVRKVEIDPPPVPIPAAPQPAAAPVVAVPAPAPLPAPLAVPAPAPLPAPLPAPPPTPAPQPAPLPPRTVPIAPAPAPAPPRVQVQRTGKPAAMAAPRTCDTLTDQLGRVLDRMDAGQRKGVTQQQMDGWRLEIQDLERKKKEAGCF